MTRQCPLDGAEIPDDREICPATEGAMRGQLRAVPELLDELDTSLARIGSTWRGDGLGRGGSGTCRMVEDADGRLHPCLHEPDSPTCTQGAQLVLNTAASEAAMQLRVVLHGWARVADEECPVPEGAPRQVRDRMLSKAPLQAAFLAALPLAGKPWVPDLAVEIRAAVRNAERAVDVAPELTFIGRCPACDMAIYAVEGTKVAQCRWCGARHDAAALHDQALAGAQSAVGSASVIARALVDPVTREPLCTSAQIRGWKHRGALEVAEVNSSGQPLYRVADVAKLARGSDLTS